MLSIILKQRGHEGTPTLKPRGHAENFGHEGTRARGHEGTPTSKARGHVEILGTRARGHEEMKGHAGHAI